MNLKHHEKINDVTKRPSLNNSIGNLIRNAELNSLEKLAKIQNELENHELEIENLKSLFELIWTAYPSSDKKSLEKIIKCFPVKLKADILKDFIIQSLSEKALDLASIARLISIIKIFDFPPTSLLPLLKSSYDPASDFSLALGLELVSHLYTKTKNTELFFDFLIPTIKQSVNESFRLQAYKCCCTILKDHPSIFTPEMTSHEKDTLFEKSNNTRTIPRLQTIYMWKIISLSSSQTEITDLGNSILTHLRLQFVNFQKQGELSLLNNQPIHGMLIAFDSIFEFLPGSYFVSNSYSLTIFLLSIVDSCSTHLMEEMDIDEDDCEEMNKDNSTKMIISSCCWRSIKACGEILVKIVAKRLSLSLQSKGRIVKLEEIYDDEENMKIIELVGACFRSTLMNMHHWGVSTWTQRSFEQFCFLLSSNQSYNELQSAWILHIFDNSSSTAVRFDERYSGKSRILLSILKSSSKNHPVQQVFTEILTEVLKALDFSDPLSANTLDLLSWLMKDQNTKLQIDNILTICVKGLSDQSSVVKSSLTNLFCSTAVKLENCCTDWDVEAFFSKFVEFKVSLVNFIDNFDMKSLAVVKHHTLIYSLLLLFSRLKNCTSVFLSKIISFVSDCGSLSPIQHIRQKAASCVVHLTSNESILEVLRKQVTSLPNDGEQFKANALQFKLFVIREIVLLSSNEITDEVTSLIETKSWLLTCACRPLACLFIDIYMAISNRCEKKVSISLSEKFEIYGSLYRKKVLLYNLSVSNDPISMIRCYFEKEGDFIQAALKWLANNVEKVDVKMIVDFFAKKYKVLKLDDALLMLKLIRCSNQKNHLSALANIFEDENEGSDLKNELALLLGSTNLK